MTMIFVIAGQLSAYLTRVFTRRREIWPDRWAGLFLGFSFAGFLILLLHAPVLPQVFSTMIGQASTVPAWKNPAWTLLELFRGMTFGLVHGTVAIGALTVFALGVLSFTRSNPVFLQLLFIPPILCAAVTLAMGHHLWPRFFFFALGFGALAAVRGAMQLGNLSTRLFNSPLQNSPAVGTVLCAALVIASAMSVPFAYAPKQDFRGALEFVQSRSEPGDAVVTVGLATFTYNTLYRTNWQSVETLETLEAIRNGAKRTWIVYTFPTHVSAVHPEIMAAIKQEFQLVKQFHGTVGDGIIFVSRSNGPLS
jgi:hypothetical protein